jgi:hypothetical protein
VAWEIRSSELQFIISTQWLRRTSNIALAQG